ncbi:MAG: type 1 glutamine amidotransferase domain-containing protein, partial [Sediminibacterium sp.]|nr:type 1 glutamine amidotransferase domain-containing protein [Sediminibacterium sp.]
QTQRLLAVVKQSFDCVYLTGGHGTMYDFTTDTTLHEIIRQHYESGKIVSAVCHGVCGLLNVQLTNGVYLVKNKKLTGYSWFEEILAFRKNAVPFNLEAELKNRKADYQKAFFPLTSKVCEDKNLITGQNPFSSKELAEVVFKRLTDQV